MTKTKIKIKSYKEIIIQKYKKMTKAYRKVLKIQIKTENININKYYSI